LTKNVKNAIVGRKIGLVKSFVQNNMNTDDNLTELSNKELAALIRGRKLGFLLAVSTLPVNIKDELAALIEEMSVEQQERLLDIFEAKYLDEQSVGAENRLRRELEPLAKKYRAEDKEREKKLAAALGRI
jgi:hypothetical protein